MNRGAPQTAEVFASGDQGGHGVFHSSVTTLDHGVLWPGVRSYVLVEERQHLSCLWLNGLPVLFYFRIVLIEEVKGHPALGLQLVVDVFQIGRASCRERV